MFPEYRELMADLKNSDSRFMELCEKHSALDAKIRNIECRAELATHEEVEILKKQKLRVKDQVFAMLRKASTQSATSA